MTASKTANNGCLANTSFTRLVVAENKRKSFCAPLPTLAAGPNTDMFTETQYALKTGGVTCLVSRPQRFICRLRNHACTLSHVLYCTLAALWLWADKDAASYVPHPGLPGIHFQISRVASCFTRSIFICSVSCETTACWGDDICSVCLCLHHQNTHFASTDSSPCGIEWHRQLECVDQRIKSNWTLFGWQFSYRKVGAQSTLYTPIHTVTYKTYNCSNTIS